MRWLAENDAFQRGLANEIDRLADDLVDARTGEPLLTKAKPLSAVSVPSRVFEDAPTVEAVVSSSNAL